MLRRGSIDAGSRGWLSFKNWLLDAFVGCLGAANCRLVAVDPTWEVPRESWYVSEDSFDDLEVLLVILNELVPCGSFGTGAVGTLGAILLGESLPFEYDDNVF
jgi:hypothetical protein